MKNSRLFGLLTIFCALLAVLILTNPTEAQATTVASGTCGASGDNIVWVLDDEGVMTFTGIGAMKNWTRYNNLPVFDSYEVKEIVIEKGITSIGDFAFYQCDAGSVIIPDSVESIGKEAFGDSSIEAIWVDSSNQHFSSDTYGVLFNKDKTVLLQMPPNRFLVKYDIPQGVVSIGDSAFSGCSWLKYVYFPDSLTSIGTSVFYCCYGLTDIVIPDGVITIGDEAFETCKNLEKVSLG